MKNRHEKNMTQYRTIIFLIFLVSILVFWGNNQTSVKAEESMIKRNLDDTQLSESLSSSESLAPPFLEKENSKDLTKTTEKNTLLADETTPVIVNSWDELAKNYNNSAVTNIQFGTNISYGTGGTTALRDRTTDISIDGNGFNLTMGNQLFTVTQRSVATFTLKNIPVVTSSRTSTVYGLVHASDANTIISGWTVNISDINSSTDNTIRITSISGAQLNLGGSIKWYTKSEMAVVDGVRIEDNAKIIGLKQPTGSDNRSFFWFAQSSMSSSSAGTHNFEVGKNASANFKMSSGGTTYPVVFAYYQTLHLEEGATFNGTMPGNAFRADYANSSFVADGNNKINFTSLSSGSAPVRFQNSSSAPSSFSVGPESELYVIAATNTPLFDASTDAIAGRTTITIDSPKNYDLRNYSSGTNYNSSIARNAFKEFTIKNSDINVWQITDNVSGPATYASTKVEYLTQMGNSTVTSSDTNLISKLPLSKVRRISGLNQNPELYFVDVTNAQKSINFETILGYTPDENGIDDTGHINYIPVYAGVGAATADIIDTFGTTYTGIVSGQNGQSTINTGKLNQSGELVKGIAYSGNRTQDVQSEYKVWDVVPPDPAIITSLDTAEGASVLEGTGEVGSNVYLYIDGNKIDSATTTVSADGTWQVIFDGSLSKVGSIATIYLEDHSGKADIANPPTTNNTNGNINPTNDMTYQDVTFKAASKVIFSKGNFNIEANDFNINAKDYPKSDEALRDLIISESEAKLTNGDTGETLPAADISVDISQLPSTSSADINKGEYQVTLPYTRGESKATKIITVKITKLSIIDPEDGVTPFTPEKEESSEAASQSESKQDLRIQYVSNFDFGATNRTFVNDQSMLSAGDYGTPEGKTAKKVPAFISVNDDRKNPTGWDLSVATKDFIQTDNGTILKGAYMTLSNFEYKGPATQKPTVSTDKVEISDAAQIVSSDSIGMNGSWSLALGELTDSGKSNGVNLTIPKNSPGSLGDYSTDIIWTVTPKLLP